MFTIISTPFLIHFSIVLPLTYIHKLDALQFIGLNCSLAATLTCLTFGCMFVYNTWIKGWLGRKVDLKAMGSWAVVTGATDGIGFAYCQELAKKGINIALISRTMEKLMRCAAELRQDFGVETKVLQFDFTDDIHSYDSMQSFLDEIDVGIVINNVGMTYSRPTIFHDLPDAKTFIHDIINMNCLAVTMMINAVLPQMLRKDKGVIVNVGSFVSLRSAPYYALYGASKAYMDSLTDALTIEYSHTGIIFQYQYPGYVSTKLSKIKNPDYATPSAESYAKMGIESIGIHERTAVWPFTNAAIYAGGIMSFVMPNTFATLFKISMRSFFVFAKKRELEKLKCVYSSKAV